MSWTASCPKCATVFAPQSGFEEDSGPFRCDNHGDVTPLWRPDQPDYDSFARLVQLAAEVAVYVPWPMSPGWQISDFGVVVDASAEDAKALGTFTTTAGTSDLDGHVEVTFVSEEPGVGLGARLAHTVVLDPGDQVGKGPALVQLRAGGHPVHLWPVDTNHDAPLAAGVFAGEADGRWLWVIMRPASAALLLRDEWLLADVTGFGPEAVEMPFGRPRTD